MLMCCSRVEDPFSRKGLVKTCRSLSYLEVLFTCGGPTGTKRIYSQVQVHTWRSHMAASSVHTLKPFSHLKVLFSCAYLVHTWRYT